jgi:Protein of unknown function (DUF3153)
MPKIRVFFRAIGYLVTISLLIVMTGCVKYDTTINFHSFNSGELIQHISLDQQFYDIDRPAIDTWLKSIEQRGAKIDAQITKASPQDLTMTLPFRRVSELVDKFNQFFAAGADTGVPVRRDRQALKAKLAIAESNFLLASRYQLLYDIDLRSLNPNQPGLEKAKALDLQFALQVPNTLNLNATPNHHWQLKLGAENHLESVFWLPNPIGLGGLAISLVVAMGYGLKSLSTNPR